VRPGLERAGAAEDLVADRELFDGPADCLNLSGKLGAENPLLRPAKAEEESDHERLAFTNATVGAGHGCGVDPDQDLVSFGYRPFDLFESLNIRIPIPVVDNGLH
jgi:hypothetical protein